MTRVEVVIDFDDHTHAKQAADRLRRAYEESRTNTMCGGHFFVMPNHPGNELPPPAG